MRAAGMLSSGVETALFTRVSEQQDQTTAQSKASTPSTTCMSSQNLRKALSVLLFLRTHTPAGWDWV
jgi:hypothetical protein